MPNTQALAVKQFSSSGSVAIEVLLSLPVINHLRADTPI